jgi:hypothetical protein
MQLYGAMDTAHRIKIGTGPQVCFCLGFLPWGIWLQGLLLGSSLASPYQRQSVTSRLHSLHEADTYTVSGEVFQLPARTALVTIYKHSPRTYHWQPDCPNVVNLATGQLLSTVLYTMTRAQAQAQGLRPCDFGGDSDAQQQVRELRSEIMKTPISLRPRT